MTATSLVVQHNKIIEAKYKLSVGEQRLIKLLISMIEKDDEDFKAYRIAVADLSKLLDISDNDFYRKVKVSAKKLISNVLTFKGFDGRELQVAWLSSAEYIPNDGVVELEFSPKLKPFLLQLKQHFTAYELGNVINLKHTYSIRIYELLKQYEKIGRRTFDIEVFRELLMLEEDQYKQFCDFRRWILKPANKELKEKTDIDFEWREERKNQKCVAIEFIIIPQKRPQKLNPNYRLMANNKAQEEGTTNTVVDLPMADKQNPTLVGLLVALGVSQKAAKSLVKEYPEERINAAVTYTQAQQKEGKVKNPSGFVVEAIKNEYRDNQAEERAEKEKVLQDAKAREEHAKRWERLKTAYAEAKKAMFEVWRSTLSEQELAEHRETFMATLAPLLKKQKNMAEQAFLAYLKSLMPFPALPEWAGQSRLNIAEFEKEIAREARQV